MRTLRFYCETLESNQAVLDGVESRHLSKVLRLGPGDEIEVFDGKGLLANAVVEHLSRDSVLLRLVIKTQIPPKTSGRVILAVSIAKGERFDWMIEKCTELGADHIAAVQYDRTVKMGKDSAIERYKKIALAAAKQCGRLHLPSISGPDTLAHTLQRLRGDYPQAILWYGDAEGCAVEKASEGSSDADKIVCIGPEGGFSEEEHQFFADCGASAVCVNCNILRIETAAIAFSALLCCGA
jgi:16S rRNA (uracil1498-N3)-methyltransferase